MKTFVTTLVVSLSLFLLACGPGEKSTELRELERLLQAPDATEVRDAPGASKAYREARQFRRFSVEAWEEGKEEISRDYAILGTLRFRTAEAVSMQMAEKERLDAANAKIEQTNPELVTLNAERNKLITEVADLERQVGLARTTHQTKQQTTQIAQSTQGTDAERRSAIIAKIREVEAVQQRAEAVNAASHAPGSYNRALNVVKSVKSLLDAGQASDGMLAQLNDAQNLFTQAVTESQAGFKDETARANPEQRRASLREEAARTFGSESVINEGMATRLVLHELFASGSSNVSPNSAARVQALTKLAEKYDEFNIFVEGFTSKTGSATENLGLSQLRAVAIRNAFTSAGIPTSRIETKGFGQDRLRFPDDARNERVEIILTRPN